MQKKIIRSFGPSIMYARISKKLVNDLNYNIDQIISKDERRSISFNANIDE